MNEVQANNILFHLFNHDIDIPEWGEWVAMDHDGEVGVFIFQPHITFKDSYGIWNTKEIKGKTAKYKLLYWMTDCPPFPELQLISVKDLLST